MRIALTTDEGEVIETYYVSETDYTRSELRSITEERIATYESREEYETLNA